MLGDNRHNLVKDYHASGEAHLADRVVIAMRVTNFHAKGRGLKLQKGGDAGGEGLRHAEL